MITRLRDGRNVELRAFALTDMLQWGYTALRGAYPTVSQSQIHGIPALYRGNRMKAEAIAGLDLCCWSGYGSERVRRDTVPQAQLFQQIPNDEQSRFDFWETVGESLAWRNVANIWKNVDPMTGRILEWYALHPDQVQTERDGSWTVTVSTGYIDPVGRGPAKYNVTDNTLLRIRGHGEGGMCDPPTPIQVFREALQSPILRQRAEATMWRRGTSLRLAIELPAGVSKEQREDFGNQWRQTYEGSDGSETAIVGGGAKIVPIGMTAQDAEYVNFSNLTVQDSSMITGVPVDLLVKRLGDRIPVGSLEESLTVWLRFGFGTDLSRIEDALKADQTLFPPGSQTYPRFDTDMFVRGDIQTEATVLVSLVQAGIITPNEARSVRGLDDIGPDGDILQITPVGGAPNPAAPDPPPSPNGNGAKPEPVGAY